MAELFWAEIVFTPAVEGETLPPELREMVADEDGKIDTTRTAQFLPARGKKAHEQWRNSNSAGGEGSGWAEQESPERLVLDMYTRWEPDLEWLSAIAAAFPKVRTVLRGEEGCHAFTVHVGYQGKKVLFHQVENEPCIDNLNLRAQVGFDFDGTWAGWQLDAEQYGEEFDDIAQNVKSVLKDRDASKELLAMMRCLLGLTPKQLAKLEAHPNYVPGFKVDPQAWETYGLVQKAAS